MRRNEKTMPAAAYKKAVDDLLTALGADDETVFAIDVQPDKATVRHVVYTQQENGTMSGDFWEDVISRDNGKHK